MCGEQLPAKAVYKMNINPHSTFATTNTERLIVRKYNLPSGLRHMVTKGIAMYANAFTTGVETYQPSIFYFHCPHCSYLHQFKSSVTRHARQNQSNTSNTIDKIAKSNNSTVSSEQLKKEVKQLKKATIALPTNVQNSIRQVRQSIQQRGIRRSKHNRLSENERIR